MSFTMKPKKNILFDLDGTLLPMDINEFEKAYFMGLCGCMIDRINPKDLYKHIWGGTKQMVLNTGPKTNMEVFRDYFNNNTSLDYDECESIFLDFYANEFQNCVNACKVTNLSKEIVSTLQEKGYTVAIATNPIFPQIATYSRLNWLHIDPESLSLVTTFENSHSAKPNPAYYKEVCESLKVAPEDCIMIGNDVAEDGIAKKLGIEVMLIEDCLLNKDNLPTDDFQMGSLKDLLEWAKSLPEAK